MAPHPSRRHVSRRLEHPHRSPNPNYTELDLFAGQLYIRSYPAYLRLCRYLGLSHAENNGDRDIPADGFVGRKGHDGTCAFETSPVAFLGVLVKRIRRDCLDVTGTHIGRVLAGEILGVGDFESEGGEEYGEDGEEGSEDADVDVGGAGEGE